jgi:heat shock protein HtpX
MIIAVALLAIAWFLSLVVRLALSRKREYLADAGSIELTKNPDAMITALRKIEGRGELEGATSAVMEMCLDNPRSGFADLFSTHPSVDSRVEAIVKFAGGHDPGPIALPPPPESPKDEGADEDQDRLSPTGPGPVPGEAPPGGPKPFLPPRPPLELGGTPAGPAQPGPWGPKPGN